MAELEIGGQTYRTGRLDAFQQADLLAYVGPLIAGGISIAGVARMDPAAVAKGVGPLADAFSAMDRAARREMLTLCASVIQRKQEKGWAPIIQNGVLMFDDIDVFQLGFLAVEVGKENLGGFSVVLDRLGLKLPEKPPEAASPE